uniref:Uncharacterized protein n=1 Tax=Arundo donax TaxID=35708 RepID=A0A0A9BE91_ARUDO
MSMHACTYQDTNTHKSSHLTPTYTFYLYMFIHLYTEPTLLTLSHRMHTHLASPIQ